MATADATPVVQKRPLARHDRAGVPVANGSKRCLARSVGSQALVIREPLR